MGRWSLRLWLMSFRPDPAGPHGILKSARLDGPFDTAVVLTREEKPGTSPTGRMVLRDRTVATKLCNVLNQHGQGKSFAVIGNLEVDDDLNVTSP